MTAMPEDTKKIETEPLAAPIESVARDFVFIGRRIGSGSNIFGAVRQIVDGQLGPDEYYGVDVMKGKIVGGIYSGAKFHEGGSRGISAATWSRRWDVSSDLIMWKALDDAVESSQRTAKLMADSKKMNEIDEILLPLRKLYANYAKQYSHSGREALEQAVVRSLRSAPRKTELG